MGRADKFAIAAIGIFFTAFIFVLVGAPLAAALISIISIPFLGIYISTGVILKITFMSIIVSPYVGLIMGTIPAGLTGAATALLSTWVDKPTLLHLIAAAIAVAALDIVTRYHVYWTDPCIDGICLSKGVVVLTPYSQAADWIRWSLQTAAVILVTGVCVHMTRKYRLRANFVCLRDGSVKA